MIKIFPTKIVLTDYDKTDTLNMLEKSLSVYNKNIMRYEFSAFLYDEEKHEITLPRGYDTDVLLKYFPSDIVENNSRVNPYKIIKPFSLKYKPKSNNQEAGIQFLVGNNFSKNSLQKFLCLQTGEGKTYCAINYLHRTRKLPLIIVDTENILNQWKKKILEFTDIKEEEIYIIQGRKTINDLMKMNDTELDKYRIFITIHRTIASLIDDKPEKLDELFNHLKLGIKIYDESHVEFKNIFLIESLTNVESIFLTATPSRSDFSENKVFQNMFRNTPKFFGYNKEREKYHNVIIYKYDTKPNQEDQANFKNKFGFDLNKYSKYLLNDRYEVFLDTIVNIIHNFDKHKGKIAIISHLIKLCDALYEDIKEEFPDKNITLYNSSSKNKEAALEGDIIITTDKSFDKAIDMNNLTVLINTVSFSSVLKTTQIVGRLRYIPNTKVFFVDLVDVGFKSLRNHLITRKKIYKNKANKIYLIDKTKNKKE